MSMRMVFDIDLSATLEIHNFLAASTVVSNSTVGVCPSPFCSTKVEGLMDSMSIGTTCFILIINNDEEKRDKRNKEEKMRKIRSSERGMRKRRWISLVGKKIYRRRLM